MNDKIELMPCACGARAEIFGCLGADTFFVECLKDGCFMSTSASLYKTKAEASEAWRTIQTSLRAGWSSEVPTENGIYLYKAENGNIMPFEVSRDGYLYYGNTEYSSRKWHGLWLRINYPEPPKE